MAAFPAYAGLLDSQIEELRIDLVAYFKANVGEAVRVLIGGFSPLKGKEGRIGKYAGYAPGKVPVTLMGRNYQVPIEPENLVVLGSAGFDLFANVAEMREIKKRQAELAKLREEQQRDKADGRGPPVHPSTPSPAASADPKASPESLDSMSTKQLMQLIKLAGLSSTGILEKEPLKQRAREAQESLITRFKTTENSVAEDGSAVDKFEEKKTPVTARATGNGAAEDEDDTADETKKKTTPNTHLRKLGTFLGLQCTCPITQGIMIEPVITADGNTYERLAIQQWLEKHDTSPKTNLPLTHKHLVPNLAMKQQIEELVLSETLDPDICEDYKEQVFMRSPEYAKKLLAEGKMEEALRLELPLAFGEMAKRSFKGTDGLPKDITLAVEWATKAGGKDGQALWVLGEAYASGAYRRGLMPDGKRIDKAVTYFRDAATMRYYPPAMCRLGIAYETADLGLVKDVKAAMSWYKKGANADHLSSMLNYGRMFEYGVGTERDYDAARLWYAKASSRGHAGSKRKLGSMLAKGRGGPIDLSGAYALWMEAAGKGDEIAKANIATFNDKLKQTLDRMFQS